MKFINKLDQLGFTLVELLVAVSIIAIVGAIGLVAYGTTQKTARMAKRVEDLKAIATALESYKSVNGVYPSTQIAFNWNSECVLFGNTAYSSDQVIPGLVPTYLATFPADPKMNSTKTNNCYAYRSTNGGNDYKIMDYQAGGEMSSSDFATQPSLIDPARDGDNSQAPPNCTIIAPASSSTYYTWAIYSPGGCNL